MIKTLHILNGDSTRQIFSETTLNGDLLVWREMLCTGPLHKDVGSDQFWIKRYDFFEKEAGIDRLTYYDKTIKEIIKIESISRYNEVVLWFEFDLFCQINLLALCSYLLKYFRKDVNYYLISTGKTKKVYLSLADYLPEEYENLYRNKIKISRNDLLFAEESWNMYVENDEEKLRKFDFSKNKKFGYLQIAMDQHLKRFSGSNGLNQIEFKILETIESGIYNKSEIIRTLLNWQKMSTVYGFGDLQFEICLKKLKNCYSIVNELYSLNTKGIEIMNEVQS